VELTEIRQLTKEEAVVFALEEGGKYFIKLIRVTGACGQLRLEEEDIIANFALFLLDHEARQVYMYRGEAQFSTYISTVFRYWLYSRFALINHRNAEIYHPDIDNFLSDQLPPEAAYIRDEEERNIMDVLAKCIAGLNHDDSLLVQEVMTKKISLKRMARDKGIKLSAMYYSYYQIIQKLRNCFQEQGIDLNSTQREGKK